MKKTVDLTKIDPIESLLETIALCSPDYSPRKISILRNLSAWVHTEEQLMRIEEIIHEAPPRNDNDEDEDKNAEDEEDEALSRFVRE